MSDLFIEQLPNNISIASGATRTAVNLDRPWQSDIAINQIECPFENGPQRELAHFTIEEDWRVIENLYTPFSFHRLIIPQVCWSTEKLRVLGGKRRIAAAVAIASKVLAGVTGHYLLTVHVGATAGQRLGHLHYHLLQPFSTRSEHRPGDETVSFYRNSNLVLFDDDSLRVVAGGIRAGQCFIVPREGYMKLDERSMQNLADLISRVITLYADKYRSLQGMPPDYMIGILLTGQNLIYGSYIPILNHWGFTEYFGLLEASPLIVPWPHSESLRYLKA